jgi:hypothetical protein
LIIPSSQPFWKKLWKLNLNDRLRLFLWKIAWNILPTTSRINSILPLPNRQPECPLCKIAYDSLHHLFFNCIFARFVWRHSFWPLDSSAFDFNTMADWIQHIISPGISLNIPSIDHHKFQIFAVVTCDLLWFYRNKFYHEGITIDIRLILKHINTVTMEHYNGWHPFHPVVTETWIPPTSPWVTINFDTAIMDSFSAQAAVCRNSEGRILHMASQISSSCNPNYGEALAAKLAVSLAASLHLDHFILEGDSQVVISTLRHPNVYQDLRISCLILKMIRSISASSSWKVTKISRSANFCAHYVAHWVATKSFSDSIPTYPSPLPSIPIVSGKDPPLFLERW